MFAILRHEKVLKYINHKKKASVKELADYFDVSRVTIRRDLQELVKRGLVVKTHGGALSLSHNFSMEIPYNRKVVRQVEEKSKIGSVAAKMIEHNDVVILDAGSTTLEIARHIDSLDRLTVVTNDLKIAMTLSHKPGITLMVAGGIKEDGVYTLIGPNAEEFFSNIRVDKTFIGADAICPEYGITNHTLQEVIVKRHMIKAADEVILVADHSKLHRKVFAYLCDVEDIDCIIVDRIEQDSRTEFTERGVKVVVAEV